MVHSRSQFACRQPQLNLIIFLHLQAAYQTPPLKKGFAQYAKHFTIESLPPK
jgi:hypothetical protein